MSTTTPTLASLGPYFSFLLASHKGGQLVHLYINGLPIGLIEGGNWKAALYSAVDAIELYVPMRTTSTP